MMALRALLSHWRRHPFQLGMLLLGLSLATALWSGVQAINTEARSSYARAAAVLGQDRLQRLGFADGRPITLELYASLRRAGWMVSPVVEGRLPEVDLRLLGIEPLTLPAPARQVELSGADLGGFLSSGGVLIVGPDTAARLAGSPLPDRRIAPDLPPGVAITDISVAQRLLGTTGISHLIVAPDSVQPDPATLPDGMVLAEPEGAQDMERLTDSFHLNLTAFGLLAFAVGLFIVYSAIGLAFEQRRGMFRTLRALGLSARALTGALLAEVLVLALLAGVAGIGLGYLIAAALLPDVAATLSGLYGAEVPGRLTLRPAWGLAGIGIAVAGTLLAAAQSLWRLWTLPVLAPAQPRAWARASARALRWQAAAGAILLGLALGIGLAPGGLWSGFALLGALLMGAALTLPAVLSLLAALGQRLARGVLAQWFWADTRQNLPRLSLALMALMLALAANVGVGTMVASFRLTFTGWLDQRLASELYVTAQSEAQAQDIRRWLEARADAVLPIWSAETDLLGQPGAVYGMTDHATYRDHWPLLLAVPDVWQQIASGQALLVNEQMFRRGGLELGDSIDLPGGALPVAGVYSDYGNPSPQVIVSTEALVARFAGVPRLRFGVRTEADGAAALAGALRDRFDLPETAVLENASVKALSLQVFERTFAVTAALNVLTLGVASLAMFASLMTLSGMRLTQLAPLWAMGLTRGRLAALDLARTALLAGLTMCLALPLGLALAWALLAVVNVAAFGWRLPMHVFPGDWLRLAAFAGLAVGLAALGPWQRLARIAPTELIKVFVNER